MKVCPYSIGIIGGYIETHLIRKGFEILLENQFDAIANHLLPPQPEKRNLL